MRAPSGQRRQAPEAGTDWVRGKSSKQGPAPVPDRGCPTDYAGLRGGRPDAPRSFLLHLQEDEVTDPDGPC